MSKTVVSYVKEGIALLKGDSDKAILERNFRLSTSAFETANSNLRARKVGVENQIEIAELDAKKALIKTETMGTTPNELNDYVQQVHRAHERLEELREELEDIDNTISKNEEYLATISKKESIEE